TAEVTAGLLFCIKSEILPVKVERLLPDSELTTIADRTHNPRACEAFNEFCECFIDLAVRNNLVTDQPAGRAIAVNPVAAHNRLSREAITQEARQAQIGHSRNNPFLARWQREVSARLGKHIVHG